MSYEVPDPVPIPADVEMPDKILAGLTARQVAIAAVAAVIIWAGWGPPATSCRCRRSRRSPPRPGWPPPRW